MEQLNLAALNSSGTKKSLTAGSIFAFGLGVYIGVVANQRYRIPRFRVPGDSGTHNKGDCEDCGCRGRPRWQTDMRDGFEKMKEFERRYRKTPAEESESNRAAKQTPPADGRDGKPKGDNFRGAWNKEWSE